MIKTKKAKEKLSGIHEQAKKEGLANWELAALLRHEGWTDDKMVSAADFGLAVARLRQKRQGGRA